MKQWVVEPEYISCIVLAILFAYTCFQRFASTPKQTAFRCSILISISAVIINIGSVHCIQSPERFPMWLNYAVNSWYFAMTLLMIGSISLASTTLIYEGRYDRPGFYNAVCVHAVAYAISLLVVFFNESTHALFYFTDDCIYTRGPLNGLAFYYTVICIATNLVCYLSIRKYVNRAFRRILFTLPAIALLFGLVQKVSPNTLLTGSAAAIALLVLFINGQLQRLNTDQLTDLGSRELFYRMIERDMAHGRPFHAIIISIRNYKDVNNRFGQRGGDAFLQQVGDYLRHLKNADACRFTGVKFAIIARETIGDSAYEITLDELCRRFREPWQAGSMETTLSATFVDIGYPELVSDVNDMIGALEYATRLAKQQGDGALLRFDKQLKSAYGRRKYVIELVNEAIRRQRFYLNFQPVFDCNADSLNGAEALVRLCENNGRSVSPGEFIPLAEETGVVSEIGWQVMELVMRFIGGHTGLPLKWISVNISAQQYQSPRFVERIEELLQRYQVPPSVLKLEITERVLVEDIDRAREIMRALKQIGVGTLLDDFGTGYSNFANVMTLPFEVVKIDKSYIDNITENQYAFGLLETIISAIRAMGMLVLAEGVETEEQRKMMDWLHVDNIQGYYFSKPLDESAFIAAVTNQD